VTAKTQMPGYEEDNIETLREAQKPFLKWWVIYRDGLKPSPTGHYLTCQHSSGLWIIPNQNLE
jgi:hypothetical protein